CSPTCHHAMFVPYSCHRVPPTTAPYTLSLHDALPISTVTSPSWASRQKPFFVPVSMYPYRRRASVSAWAIFDGGRCRASGSWARDRKSTRLNSRHVKITYDSTCAKTKERFAGPLSPTH